MRVLFAPDHTPELEIVKQLFRGARECYFAILTFAGSSGIDDAMGIRSVRRSVSTSNGEPLGRVLEARFDRIERRLDGLDRSVDEVREWLAFREGRERPPLWLPRGAS